MVNMRTPSRLVPLFGMLLVAVVWPARPAQARSAAEILEDAGVSGGLAVVVGDLDADFLAGIAGAGSPAEA